MDKIQVKRFTPHEEWFSGEKFSFSTEFYSKFVKQMRKESDRSCVLVVAAIIDANLKERISKKLIHGSTETKKNLFEIGGPFHSFAPKIDWLFCTGEITKPVRDDLHIIRKLRNQCAHNLERFVFDKSVEANYLSRMNTYTWIKLSKKYFLSTVNRPSNTFIDIKPRLQFTIMSSILLSTLIGVQTKSINLQLSFAP